MGTKGQGPILIAGQTASGKSGLALEVARQVDGAIINADSMQVYKELQVLTARPNQGEMQGIPHFLYGHVAASTPYSVGHWLEDVQRTLDEIAERGKRAIIVGGTGLYFKALLDGLSPVPGIPDSVRDKWRERALDQDYDLHKRLSALDPQMAVRLRASDRQRLARALEVFDATGKSLACWQQQPGERLIDPETAIRLFIEIERSKLYERCDQRFDQMMDRGALEEVEKLVALQLPSTLPAMRALGVRPLKAFLAGQCSRQEAVEKTKTETRQYAKRQNTWMQGNYITLSPVFIIHTESFTRNILPYI